MPRKCKTCAHSSIAEVDKAILGNIPYTQIASKFGLHHKSIDWHSKHHLQPMIDEANAQAKEAIVSKILKYREEVNYSAFDKVKLLQEKILTDLDGAGELNERVPLYREFRGAIQEEAKLSGLYQQDRKNQAELIDAVKQMVDNGVAHSEDEAFVLLGKAGFDIIEVAQTQ